MTLNKDRRMNTFKDFILHIQGTINSSKEKQETALYMEYMNQITNENKTFFFMNIRSHENCIGVHLRQSSTTYKELKKQLKENESPESYNSKGCAVQRQCIFSINQDIFYSFNKCLSTLKIEFYIVFTS